MAYQVNYTTGVIYIPQSDLIYLEPGKYKLDLNTFRKKCRDLEDDFVGGLSYPVMVEYNTAVDTGDVILARVVLLINGYTVTFEDGQYAVLFDGANTNVHNFTNVNQVSIRPNNSTGLQDLSTLLAMAYMDRVVVDVVSGQAGVGSPIGTLGTPSGNVPDAMQIAQSNGITKLLTIRNLTIGSGDNVEGIIISGIDAGMTSLTIEDAAECNETQFANLYITGILDGDSTIDDCIVGDLTYFNGVISHSAMAGEVILEGGANAHLHNCSMHDYSVPATLNMGGAGQDLVATEWTGLLTITNMTGANDTVGVGMLAGMIVIDSSCTAGLIQISGIGEVIDNSTGTCVVDTSKLINSRLIADAVLDSDIGC